MSITIQTCGAAVCSDGAEHDNDGPEIEFTDEETGRVTGGTTTCSRCGSDAMTRSLFHGE